MSVAAEKLRLTEEIVSSIAVAMETEDPDEDILCMFVDSCCFRQVASRWQNRETGFNLLQLAVLNKRFAVVKFLCKPENKLIPWRPVNDQRGRVINSPLHLACKVGSLEIIRFLLGAEEDLSDMMSLRTEGYVSSTNYVTESDVPKLPFEVCVEGKHVECCMFLCNFILSGCSYKETPEKVAMLNASSLHKACHLGSAELLAVLLQDSSWAGYINSYDSLGFTPLHVAAMCGESECLEILLKHHANITVYADCRSVLHILYSYKRKPRNFVKCTNILISYGADVNASDHNENTPLDYVAYEFGQKIQKNQMHELHLAYTHYDNHQMNKHPEMTAAEYRGELLRTMELQLEAGARTHTVISHTPDGVLVDHTIIHTLLQNTGWPLSSCILNSAQDVYATLELLFKFGSDPNVLTKHSLMSSFTTLLLQSLHEVRDMTMKLNYLFLFIKNGADLECTIPPPRHFRKHPEERIWSVKPMLLALQEKHPVEVLQLLINFMSLDSINQALRSTRMREWYYFRHQLEVNMDYKKEWLALRASLRNHVRSLKHLCKLRIISCVGQDFDCLAELPLPKCLLRYLDGIDC